MMQIKYINYLSVLILLMVFVSCVKEIEPDLSETDTKKVVISGRLTDREGFQKVDVSLTGSLSDVTRNALNNCKVILHSSNGKSWNYTEEGNGIYQLWLNKNELDLTREYFIEVITPDQQHITSRPEGFLNCPPVDSVYYAQEETNNTPTGEIYQGLQFYMDFKGDDTESRYYLIDVIETCEYHSSYPIEWWYDGQLHKEVPPDYSKSICWRTRPIKDVFVLTTDNLSSNEYEGLKLNFTDDHSQRLSHLYSINVQQYSLSKAAYNYWKEMRTNLHQSGDLYNTQPFAIKGNLENITHPERGVLGYFMVSKMREKRIFIPPPGFATVDNLCGEPTRLRFGLRDILPNMYPAYLGTSPSGGYTGELYDKACMDCTSTGGTTTKPDFWP